MLQLFVCQSRHPAKSFNINVQDLTKNTKSHGSSNQTNRHLTTIIDALQINQTGTITVVSTANVIITSQNDHVDHLRALIDNCAEINLDIKPAGAPDHINTVNQKNPMSPFDRMNLTRLPQSGKKLKASRVLLENSTVHDNQNKKMRS